MAVDALSAMLVNGRKGREYQAPRSYNAIADLASDRELVFPVMPSETVMEEYRPKKRINIMIPVDLLERIDSQKNERGVDRSKFICEAVADQLEQTVG